MQPHKPDKAQKTIMPALILRFFVIIIALAHCTAFATVRPCIDILPAQNLTANARLDSLITQFIKQLAAEELTSGTTAIGTARDSACAYQLRATIDSSLTGTVILLELRDRLNGIEEEKLFPVDIIDNDRMLLDFMSLKVRQFIEDNQLGTLSISSLPLESAVLLNGIHTGYTPLSVVLSPGGYKVTLQHAQAHPYSESVRIPTRGTVPLKVQLTPRGSRLLPLYLSSAVALGGTLLSAVIEYQRHQQYRSLERFNPNTGERVSQQIYDEGYADYQSAAQLRIGFSLLSIPLVATSAALTLRKQRIVKSWQRAESKKKSIK
jgi:hypothetical protein